MKGREGMWPDTNHTWRFTMWVHFSWSQTWASTLPAKPVVSTRQLLVAGKQWRNITKLHRPSSACMINHCLVKFILWMRRGWGSTSIERPLWATIYVITRLVKASISLWNSPSSSWHEQLPWQPSPPPVGWFQLLTAFAAEQPMRLHLV